MIANPMHAGSSSTLQQHVNGLGFNAVTANFHYSMTFYRPNNLFL